MIILEVYPNVNHFFTLFFQPYFREIFYLIFQFWLSADFHVILNIFKLLFHIYTGTISFALSTLVLFCQWKSTTSDFSDFTYDYKAFRINILYNSANTSMMVSSPANVPNISSNLLLSISYAIWLAWPGKVWTTARLPENFTDKAPAWCTAEAVRWVSETLL